MLTFGTAVDHYRIASFWEHSILLSAVRSTSPRMATVSDAAKADGYMKSCTKLVSFRTPICKPTLDFHASFKHSIGSPETAALIRSLSDARADLVSAYQSSSSYDVKIKCAEDYIPLLYRLVDSINSAQKLQLDKELSFEWQGGITQKGEFFKSNYVLYELLMVFHAKVRSYAQHKKIASQQNKILSFVGNVSCARCSSPGHR